MDEDPRITREKKTIGAMVRLYCRDRHGTGDGLCGECRELLEYAHMRLDRCRYGGGKPTCGKCPAHCYKPSMKARVMDVMRYAGPRMTYRHPVHALRHFFDGFRRVPRKPGRPSVIHRGACSQSNGAVPNSTPRPQRRPEIRSI